MRRLPEYKEFRFTDEDVSETISKIVASVDQASKRNGAPMYKQPKPLRHAPPVSTPKWRIAGRLLIDLVKLVIWKVNKLFGGY
jgi:hypothetical protein